MEDRLQPVLSRTLIPDDQPDGLERIEIFSHELQRDRSVDRGQVIANLLHGPPPIDEIEGFVRIVRTPATVREQPEFCGALGAAPP